MSMPFSSIKLDVMEGIDAVLAWNSLCTQAFEYSLFKLSHLYAEFIPEIFLVIN